jgi:hypothetical protein
MWLPPMHVPAELRQRVAGGTVVVARGSLVLMAHGLCAVAPALRSDCWIEAEGGTLDAEDTAALLHHWTTGTGEAGRV